MTYTRLEVAKHRKWFIHSSRRCCVVFFSVVQCHFALWNMCFCLRVCAHRLRQATKKKTYSTYASSYCNNNSVLLVVFVLVLITINYLIISLYGSFHFWISWNIMTGLQERGYQISFRFYFIFPMPMQSICQVLRNCHSKIEIEKFDNFLNSILLSFCYLFIQWLYHV